jgi:hypothetical protein
MILPKRDQMPRLFPAILVFLLAAPGFLAAQTLKQYKITVGAASPGMVIKAFVSNADNTIVTIEYDMKQMEGESKTMTMGKKTYLVSTATKEEYKLIKSDFLPLCPKKFENEFKDKIITFKLYFPVIKEIKDKQFDLEEREGCSGVKNGFKISAIKVGDFSELNDAEYYLNNPDKIVKIKKIHQPIFVTAVCKIFGSAINNNFKEVTGQLKGGSKIPQYLSKVLMPSVKPLNNVIADYGDKKEYYAAFVSLKDSSLDATVYMMDSLKGLLEQVLWSDYYTLDLQSDIYEKLYVFVRKDDNKANDPSSEQTQFPNITICVLKNKHNIAMMIGNMNVGYIKP